MLFPQRVDRVKGPAWYTYPFRLPCKQSATALVQGNNRRIYVVYYLPAHCEEAETRPHFLTIRLNSKLYPIG